MILTNVIITAYCGCALCCGKAGQPTASGKMPVQGITIAAPRNVPLGTRVVVSGHTYIVQDRTAKRFDGRYDVYFKSHKDALQWGKQQLNITIIP
jgi:3D (Asp-Asp-Asp) domain-containing protein